MALLGQFAPQATFSYVNAAIRQYHSASSFGLNASVIGHSMEAVS